MYTVGSTPTIASYEIASFSTPPQTRTYATHATDLSTSGQPQPHACLKGGGGNVKIEGFGTVIIKPEPVDNGDCELTLQNVPTPLGSPSTLFHIL